MTYHLKRLFLYLYFLLCFISLAGAQAGNTVGSTAVNWVYLAGTDAGLYGINRNGVSSVLMNEGKVRRILRAGSLWVLLTNEGILVSHDLRHWEKRNQGLPFKTIKIYDDGQKSFIQTVQEIKDIKIHPQIPEIMTAATKDSVFLSRNAGQSWTRLGMPSYRTNGIKAVAVASLPQLVVFLSHSTYGLHYIEADDPAPKWI